MVHGFSRITEVRVDVDTRDPKTRGIRGNPRSIRENLRPGFRLSSRSGFSNLDWFSDVAIFARFEQSRDKRQL